MDSRCLAWPIASVCGAMVFSMSPATASRPLHAVEATGPAAKTGRYLDICPVLILGYPATPRVAGLTPHVHRAEFGPLRHIRAPRFLMFSFTHAKLRVFK